MKIAIIGYGEAGQMFGDAFARHLNGGPLEAIQVFDINMSDDMRARAHAGDISVCNSIEKVLAGSSHVFSLVTADQAECVAQACAPLMNSGRHYFEMNSISPKAKQRNGERIPSLCDVAIMAPVHPKRHRVPLLVSSAHADIMAGKLNGLGLNAKPVGSEIGRAAAIKMCRSVMIKGMEALTLECFQTAQFYDVEDEVKSSLHASFPGMGWDKDRVDYWFERVTTHGVRRAEEMREVAKTVKDANVDTEMSKTVAETFDRFTNLQVQSEDEGKKQN